MDHPGAEGGESRIAQERTGPGPAPLHFWLVAGLLAFGVAAVAFAGGRAAGPTAAEGGEAGGLMAAFPVAAGRVVAALGAGLLAFATALAGRRLFHSTWAGLVGALLLAADPWTLVAGRLAVAAAPAAGLAVLAFALATYPRPEAQWAGSGALAVAALLDVRVLLWGPPLAAVLLLRGHIYAAPQHLGTSLAKAFVLPGLAGLGAALAGADPAAGCLEMPAFDALLLLEAGVAGEGTVLMPNPATWFAGLGGLLFLGSGALGIAATRFRVARLPGRIQFRLDGPPHPLLARSLWVVLLAVLAPFPLLWLPLFALVVAAGVRELADDAPGFGLAVGLVVVALAALVLARAWPVVAGTGGPEDVRELMGLVPWSDPQAC